MSDNGHQQRVDEAVSLADRTVGAAVSPAGYRGSGDVSSWAPLQPAAPPAPILVPAFVGAKGSETYGVSGTAITSGFITDLGEYNPELMGRNAVIAYEKMRRGNAMVRAVLQACKLPVRSAKWDVVPSIANNEPGYQQAKEISDALRENLFGGLEYQSSIGDWVSQPWSDVIRTALLMLDFGCSVVEEVWTVDGNQLRLRNLPARQALTYYRWRTDPDGETLISLEQYGYRGNEFKNVSLPANKMTRWSYEQEGANFWGIALLRAMYPHWFYADRLMRIDAIACERNGMGVPCWKLPPGFSEQDRAAARNTVTQLSAHEATGIVEPPGDASTGLRLVGLTGSVRQIQPSIALQNTLMAKSALAMFMESGTMPHGSRSTAQTHSDFFMLAEQSLADQIAETLTESLARRWTEFNYGPDALSPRIIAANVEARRLEDISQSLTQMAQAGLIVSEDNIRGYIRNELALPEESDQGIVAVKGMTVTPEGEVDKGEVGGAGKMTEYFRPLTPAAAARLAPGVRFALGQPIEFTRTRNRTGRSVRLVESSPLVGPALAVMRAGEFQVLREQDGDLVIAAAGGRS